MIRLAKDLRKEGYNFNIKMLGTGVLENKIKNDIKKYELEDTIQVIGQVSSDEVKNYMEKANIFIGTSDSNEGWGAVINESMNAGCAIVANKRMGSVPYLIGNENRGIMYNNYSDLKESVEKLIKDKNLRKELSVNAYKYITTEWTSEIAANNLLELFNSIIEGKEKEIKYGPASKANNYTKKI